MRRTATILLALGLIISALGAEALAVYNSCFADPICYPTVSGDGWVGFFGILAVGLLLILGGALLLRGRVGNGCPNPA